MTQSLHTRTAKTSTDDVRISAISELAPPGTVLDAFPVSAVVAQRVTAARQSIHRVLHGADDRLVVVIGPCSIHDTEVALDYARRLVVEAERLSDDLLIIMRVYFEKPRTTVGWKGLINDPHLDNSFDINEGLRRARKLLLDVNMLGLPCATEFLDMITPQYVADLISWGAIGARTTESQVHRELASGLSCPVGFKNGTDGNVRIAMDAIRSAQSPHHFLSVTKSGRAAIVQTIGNEDCHIILRGGKEPNYDPLSVNVACTEMAKAGIPAHVMIDFSHGNSRKEYQRQMEVATDVAGQLAAGEERIMGVMVESHINAGRQDMVVGKALAYGISITDACINWDDSVKLLNQLASSVRQRRLVLTDK